MLLVAVAAAISGDGSHRNKDSDVTCNPYSNWRIRISPCANERARPGGPSDPLRATRSLRVARRVARVVPSRPESLDPAAPNDKSRPKRAPETLRDTIFDDFWSIFGSIFVVFRGCSRRATKLAARRADPLFLLAGVVRNRHFALCEKTENRQKSTKNRSDDASRTRSARKTKFFRPRMRLGVNFGRPGTLPGAPGRPFWRPGAPLATLRALPGCAGDAPGCSRDAPETPLGRSWTPRGVRRGSRERF